MGQIYDNIGKKKNVKKYKQLSHSERIKIEQLYNEGYNINQISKAINRDYNTVKREIQRNGTMNQPSLSAKRQGIKKYRYNANTAQKKRDERYLRPMTPRKFDRFIKYCNKVLKAFVTLEEVLMDFKKNMNPLEYPCLKTMYNWAHKGIIKTTFGTKPTKSPRRRYTGAIEDKRSIHERENDFGFPMDDYSHRGHYEIDTIYNGDKMGGVLTFNERSTRKLYAVQITDRKAITINKALRSIIDKVGAHNIKSITSDNGSEFSYSKVIEVCYNLKWYYCDPYSSWQRGQNERLNKDIRKFYPKHTIFTNIRKKEFAGVIDRINNKPRRIFKGLSSNEYSLMNS